MLQMILLNGGYPAVCLKRDQVWDELPENVAAVFLEIYQEGDLVFIRELRAKTPKPLLVYSEGAPESMQIESLVGGADMFLCVSDSSAVVEARVNAFLRRVGLEPFH